LKAKDKIAENYRKQVDNLLDNQSVTNLSGPLDQAEIEEIWREIATEMDIGEVWEHISSDLDIVMPVDINYGIFVKSIAAALIILIGFVPVNKTISDSPVHKHGILIENTQNAQPEELIGKKLSGDNKINEKDKGSLILTSVIKNAKSKNDVFQETEIPVAEKVVPKIASDSYISDLNKDFSADYPINVKSGSGFVPAEFPQDELSRIQVYEQKDFSSLKGSNTVSAGLNSLPTMERGKVSAGIITLFKNTWLLNQETYDGLKSESLNSSEIVFYPDFGLTLAYHLNKNWLVQTDGYFFSNTGQEYLEYLYGHYAKKKITLRYSTIALSIKYKFTGSELVIPRSSINVAAGGYLSVLQYATQRINTDLENIRSQYRNFDFGVRFAGEIEFRIFNQFSLAPGISMSLGIPNIYKGNSTIPANLITTHNGSVDLQLTLYYDFK
jgi:hypothetical protein